jgi:hypothetical protein
MSTKDFLELMQRIPIAAYLLPGSIMHVDGKRQSCMVLEDDGLAELPQLVLDAM